MDIPETAWVPQACTLPTAEQPLRVAEFDELFADALLRVERPHPTRLRLSFEAAPAIEKKARELTRRETQCCSFFAFSFRRLRDALKLSVRVPATRLDILDALQARTGALIGAAR